MTDLTALVQRIKDQQATRDEILFALSTCPPEALSPLVEAVAGSVAEGNLSLTPFEWRPVLRRLGQLHLSWPGPACEQCGSPLGDPDSDNNFGGLCYYCNAT